MKQAQQLLPHVREVYLQKQQPTRQQIGGGRTKLQRRRQQMLALTREMAAAGEAVVVEVVSRQRAEQHEEICILIRTCRKHLLPSSYKALSKALSISLQPRQVWCLPL
jgi:hypothetical protein